ncbi:MAG: hypothetical protein PGN26_00275 [Xylophilus ampelinus]
MASISWTCILLSACAVLACWAVGARRRMLRLHAAAQQAAAAWRAAVASAQDAAASRARYEAAVARHDAALAQRPARWLACVLRRTPWGPL